MIDMKKIALLFAVALTSAACFAQVTKGELKQLQNFLAQPAAEGGNNAEALRITNPKDPSTWEGVTVSGNHVVAIDWKGKKLGGALDLSGFSALTKVDVSRNKITSFTVNGDAALTEVNCSRNRITDVDFSGCTSLVKIAANNNRITDFEITGTPAIKNINISANLLASLDLR